LERRGAQLYATLRGHKADVRGVVFSSDGNYSSLPVMTT
jgi:hypothetical protein